MNEDFNKILEAMLDSYESGKSADEVIAEAASKANLSEEGKELLQETNKVLDAYEVKAQSLSQAKSEGQSRLDWIETEMNSILEERTDEEKSNVVTAITDAMDNAAKEIIIGGKED